MKLKLRRGKGTCVSCSLLHTTKCPHAMWMSNLDITKHHCVSFKKIRKGGVPKVLCECTEARKVLGL